MKTLKNYITKAFLATFLVTVVVLTFVLTIGGLFKLTDLVSRGVSASLVFKVFLSGMPSVLAFAIPISAITATLLVFGRLSADSEVTAMKACGISLWRVVTWMLPPAFLLLAVCLYINSELVPQSHYIRRTASARLGVVNPVELIEEGRTVREFEGLSLYVGRKRGSQIEDVRIFDQREGGRTREIKAERGEVVMPADSSDMVLVLDRVTIDPFTFDHPGKATMGRWTLRIEDVRRGAYYRKRDKDLTLSELCAGIEALWIRAGVEQGEDSTFPPSFLRTFLSGVFHVFAEPAALRLAGGERRREAMGMLVELHKRLALASSCLAFVFLGIPLGVRSHRKESSLGIALSLLVVFVFYMFIIVAEQLTDQPHLQPHLLNWFPVLLALVLGAWMTRRLN